MQFFKLRDATVFWGRERVPGQEIPKTGFATPSLFKRPKAFASLTYNSFV